MIPLNIQKLVNEKNLFHVYGYDTTDKDVLLPELVRTNAEDKVHLLIFYNPVRAKYVRQSLRNTGVFILDEVSEARDHYPKPGFYILSPRQAKKFLLHLASGDDKDKNLMGSIFLIGFEKENVEAMFIWAIFNAYCDKVENIRFIVLTVSKYSWSPTDKLKIHEFASKKIQISFDETACGKLAKKHEKFYYFGPNIDAKEQIKPGDKSASDKLFHALKNTKNKFYTKHHIDLNINTLKSGKVVICATEAAYSELQPRYEASYDFRKSTAELMAYRVERLIEYFPQQAQEEFDRSREILEKDKLTPVQLFSLSNLPLSFDLSVFLTSIMSKEKEKRLDKLFFIAVACLIDNYTVYGNLSFCIDYRDDLEILVSMWNEIIIATKGNCYMVYSTQKMLRSDKYETKEAEIVAGWAKSMKLDIDAILKLCQSVSNTLLYLSKSGVKSLIPQERTDVAKSAKDSIRKYTKHFQTQFFTSKLNIVREYFYKNYQPENTKDLNFSLTPKIYTYPEAISDLPDKVVVIKMLKANKVGIYTTGKLASRSFNLSMEL